MSCSPCVSNRRESPPALLHEENRSVWERWFAAAGVPEAPLGPAQIFAEDIAAGRLVPPFDLSIRHGAYWLVARNFKRLSPEAHAFREWLVQRIAVRGRA